MTDSDDNLKAALAQNGSYDPKKAAETGNTVVSAFAAKMRKVERRVWIWGIACKCVAVFAVLQFLHSMDTKSMLMNVFIAILLLEMIMMYKLWYWILNNKLSVLKEIKLLRAETSVLAESAGTRGLGDLVDEPVQGLPGWERRFWFGLYVVCMILVFMVKMPDVQRVMRTEGITVHDGYVTLAADGSGTTVTKTSSPNQGAVPAVSFPFDVPSGSTMRWLDEQGRELPVAVSTNDGRDRYTVSFIDPPLPGERISYTRVSEAPELAAKEGDLWTCSADWSFGLQPYRYNETVMLPAGAEVVSVTPYPSSRFISSSGNWIIRFRSVCEAEEHFSYTIQYRLP